MVTLVKIEKDSMLKSKTNLPVSTVTMLILCLLAINYIFNCSCMLNLVCFLHIQLYYNLIKNLTNIFTFDMSKKRRQEWVVKCFTLNDKWLFIINVSLCMALPHERKDNRSPLRPACFNRHGVGHFLGVRPVGFPLMLWTQLAQFGPPARGLVRWAQLQTKINVWRWKWIRGQQTSALSSAACECA